VLGKVLIGVERERILSCVRGFIRRVTIPITGRQSLEVLHRTGPLEALRRTKPCVKPSAHMGPAFHQGWRMAAPCGIPSPTIRRGDSFISAPANAGPGTPLSATQWTKTIFTVLFGVRAQGPIPAENTSRHFRWFRRFVGLRQPLQTIACSARPEHPKASCARSSCRPIIKWSFIRARP
jgi:hypothetical protein